jgi:putative tricarboxylic transport membrane protein
VRLAAHDLWTGLLLMALAGAYYASASAIPESLLSDEVGAGGLPKLLAVALGVSGALLALRSQSLSALGVTLSIAPRAVGLVAVLALYIALLPTLGYAVSMAALIAVAALVAGARSIPALVLTAVVAAIGFQLVFVRLFHIAMPGGLLARWM